MRKNIWIGQAKKKATPIDCIVDPIYSHEAQTHLVLFISGQ
jgi:hypothetical protein